MPLSAFLESAAAPYRSDRKTITISVTTDDSGSDSDEVLILRRPEWLHALSAFIENAVDFARTGVWVSAEVTKTYVSLTIDDDGPGFAPDILSRLGEPYISSRSYDEDMARDGKFLGAQSHSGMGLGFFIAKTLCEHTGAVVSFGNRDAGGAYVKALWARDQIGILWSKDA